MISKQFALWVGIATLAFTVSVIGLDELGAPTILVFLAGMAFNAASDPVIEWFMSWESAEKRAEYSGNSD